MSLLRLRQQFIMFVCFFYHSCHITVDFTYVNIAECHYHLVSTEQIRKLKEKNKSPSVHINVFEN